MTGLTSLGPIIQTFAILQTVSAQQATRLHCLSLWTVSDTVTLRSAVKCYQIFSTCVIVASKLTCSVPTPPRHSQIITRSVRLD